MALIQRITTRWIQRVGTWIAPVAHLTSDALKAFFNFKKEDGLLTKGGKTANVAARQGAYMLLDNYLWGLSAALYVGTRVLDFPFLGSFAALWAFDFVAAGAFVLIYEKTGEDLSLGKDFRRAADVAKEKSWLLGYSIIGFVIFKAIFWTGPEKIITFFRKEIGSLPGLVLMLLFLTGLQALIWVVLYSLSYGLVTGT